MAEVGPAPRGVGTYRGRVVVSISVAAQRAGVSRRTIYNWLDSGRIESVTVGPSRRTMIVEDSLWGGSLYRPADATEG